MTTYDNNNSGAVFRPHPNQTLVGQGFVNVDGIDFRAVLVKEPVKRDGEPIYNLYLRAGPLFPNDKRGNEKAPDYSGPLDTHPGKRVAAWARQKDGKHYMSLAISARGDGGGSERRQEDTSGSSGSSGYGYDDDIPF